MYISKFCHNAVDLCHCIYSLVKELYNLLCTLQALSISRSLSEAKVAARKGQINSSDLINLVIQAIQEAGGTVDYAEARHIFPVIMFLIMFCFLKGISYYAEARCHDSSCVLSRSDGSAQVAMTLFN